MFGGRKITNLATLIIKTNQSAPHSKSGVKQASNPNQPDPSHKPPQTPSN
jgi:hypothetical protein